MKPITVAGLIALGLGAAYLTFRTSGGSVPSSSTLGVGSVVKVKEKDLIRLSGFLFQLNSATSLVKITVATPGLLTGQVLQSEAPDGGRMDYGTAVPPVLVSFTPEKVLA